MMLEGWESTKLACGVMMRGQRGVFALCTFIA